MDGVLEFPVAVPRRARIPDPWTFQSLNLRLESNQKEEEESHLARSCGGAAPCGVQEYLAHEKSPTPLGPP